jgi:diguanylate cyclase (GGDEF)-like protein
MASSRPTQKYPTVRILEGRGWLDLSQNEVFAPPEGDSESVSRERGFYFYVVEKPTSIAVLSKGGEELSGDADELQAVDMLLDRYPAVVWSGLEAEGVGLGEAHSDQNLSAMEAACAMAIVKAQTGTDTTDPQVLVVSGDKSGIVTVRLQRSEDHFSSIAQTPRFGSKDLLAAIKNDLRSAKGCSLVLANVDHAKALNDSYGYKRVDLTLARIHRLFEIEEYRNHGDFYRVGGDNFVMLIPGADTKSVELLAERLRRGVEEMEIPLNYRDSETSERVTLSVGVVHVSADAQTSPKEVWQIAEYTIWKAKEAGRNTIKVAVGI